MALKWLKQGSESEALAKQEAVAAEQRKAEQGKMWRFFLKDGEEARITFVDGELNSQGFLTPPRFYEHTLYVNGSYNNYVCPEKTNPESGEKCPICEGGDRATLVSLFTIIDHREYKGKNDQVYKDTPKLLVAKPTSFELLNKLAVKRGGLAGVTFDASRMGDKAAAIGSLFDYVEKHDIETLQKEFTRKVKDDKGVESIVSIFKPADYEHEIVYRTAQELRDMGFGKGGLGSGQQKGNAGGGQSSAPDSQVDYSQQL